MKASTKQGLAWGLTLAAVIGTGVLLWNWISALTPGIVKLIYPNFGLIGLLGPIAALLSFGILLLVQWICKWFFRRIGWLATPAPDWYWEDPEADRKLRNRASRPKNIRMARRV